MYSISLHHPFCITHPSPPVFCLHIALSSVIGDRVWSDNRKSLLKSTRARYPTPRYRKDGSNRAATKKMYWLRRRKEKTDAGGVIRKSRGLIVQTIPDVDTAKLIKF